MSAKTQDTKAKVKVVKTDKLADKSVNIEKSERLISGKEKVKTEIKSKDGDRKQKNAQISNTKIHNDNSGDDSDPMNTLLNMNQFDTPVKKKMQPKLPKSKELCIDLENDSQEEIIRKLVLNVQSLRSELNEYKIYADGTFCTSTVHNRATDDLDKRVTELRTQIDEMA